MMNVAVGFDTSCYTTSAAAINQQGEVVAFARKLLPVEEVSPPPSRGFLGQLITKCMVLFKKEK